MSHWVFQSCYLMDSKPHLCGLGHLFTLTHDTLGKHCVFRANQNNQEDYTIVIGFLINATPPQLYHLIIYLNSQPLITQLDNVYHFCDPCFFRKYLQVKLLSRNFQSITFIHILRSVNQFLDNNANEILD
jgi:hypothetical protein